MKEKYMENLSSSTTPASETSRQNYNRMLKQRLALSDADTNAIIAEQTNAINRQPIGGFIACPQNPPDGFPDATSQRFYYLSEIVGDATSPTECGAALACFLSWIVAAQINPDDNPAQVHSRATLVVDRGCVVHQTLTLPDRFTLAGVGPWGEGYLEFEDLPDDTSALRFAPAEGSSPAIRMTTIRDLRISGEASCCGQVGINVSQSQFVYIDRVWMHDFDFGVFGETAYSIFITNSFFNRNDFAALMMGEGTTTWRIRDSVMNFNMIGAFIAPAAHGHLISGARIEQNARTGVLVNGSRNVIENGWFENNGTGLPHYGIRITDLAQKNRILSNLFSSDSIQDLGTETRCCFNISWLSNSDNVNQENCQ